MLRKPPPLPLLHLTFSTFYISPLNLRRNDTRFLSGTIDYFSSTPSFKFCERYFCRSCRRQRSYRVPGSPGWTLVTCSFPNSSFSSSRDCHSFRLSLYSTRSRSVVSLPNVFCSILKLNDFTLTVNNCERLPATLNQSILHSMRICTRFNLFARRESSVSLRIVISEKQFYQRPNRDHVLSHDDDLTRYP